MTDGSTIKTTEYLDGFQYEDETLQFFPHAEGYVKATVMTMGPGNPVYGFNYVYNYTDHLGNIRLSYAKDPQTGDLKVMEENNYYPYGLKHNYGSSSISLDFQKQLDDWGVILAPVTNNPYNYKYNGKELQDELGLNMYDMDMRMYDPAIARWVVMDPVIHHSMSPYNAFDNNPVFWADPSGADAEQSSGSSDSNNSDSGSKDYNPSGIRAMGIPIETVMATSMGGGLTGNSGDSTGVRKNADGTHTVVDAKNDGDSGVYEVDDNGCYDINSSNKVGETLNPWDFMKTNDQTGAFEGAAEVTFDINNLKDAKELINSLSKEWKMIVAGIQDSKTATALLAVLSRNNGRYDIKSNFSAKEGGKYTALSYDGKITSARTTGNILFGQNLRTINTYSADQLFTPAKAFYIQTMPVVGAYNQYQNNGNGYNAGWPFYGEHTYSGTGIYFGYFGKNP